MHPGLSGSTARRTTHAAEELVAHCRERRPCYRQEDLDHGTAPRARLRQFSTRTGLPPTGRTTLAKLHWEAAIGGRTGFTWLGVPEFVAHRLGARRVAERSLASRTGAYDVLADAWIPEHLDAAGLPDLRMPMLCSAD